jgi:hypothetical protein
MRFPGNHTNNLPQTCPSCDPASGLLPCSSLHPATHSRSATNPTNPNTNPHASDWIIPCSGANELLPCATQRSIQASHRHAHHNAHHNAQARHGRVVDCKRPALHRSCTAASVATHNWGTNARTSIAYVVQQLLRGGTYVMHTQHHAVAKWAPAHCKATAEQHATTL